MNCSSGVNDGVESDTSSVSCTTFVPSAFIRKISAAADSGGKSPMTEIVFTNEC